MDARSGPSRRAILAGLGGLAAGTIGGGYLGAASAQAARPHWPHTGPWRLVPDTGAWFGAYPGAGNAPPWAYEAMTGRKLDIVMRYEALDSVWPNAADQALIAEGRWLAVCWSSRLRASGTVATWADVAAGRYDEQLTAQAHRLAAVGQVLVGYDNEMDGRNRIASSGPLSDYQAAYHHVRGIVKAIAPYAIWMWCPTGSNRTKEVADCYPGDGCVDWICYDPYDPTLSKGGPLEAYRPFPEWLAKEGIGAGKPLGICETGFHRDRDNAGEAAAWMKAVPDAIGKLGIRMWLWFNSSGGLGDTSVAPGTAAAGALKQIGNHPILKRPH